MATTESFRLSENKSFDSSSEEEGELSSGGSSGDEICQRKRTKTNDFMDDDCPQGSFQPTSLNHKGRKRNNIWGSVIADQSTNDISTSLGVVGMKNFMSRGPESFSLRLAYQDQNYEKSSSDSEEVVNEQQDSLDQEIENYLIDRHHRNKYYIESENKPNVVTPTNCLKRKRPKKKKKPISKPGKVPKYAPGQKVKLNKKVEIYPSDSEEKVADEITFRLWEKKKDLIKNLVSAIGVEQSILLYSKTEAIEACGGLMILNGSRRRTPGGTFLHLLRSSEDVDQDLVNKIFEVESFREKEQWALSKKSNSRDSPLTSAIDVGETPRNSPLMKDCMDTTTTSNTDCNNTVHDCQMEHVTPENVITAKECTDLSDGEIKSDTENLA